MDAALTWFFELELDVETSTFRCMGCIQYNVVFIEIYKTQNKVHPIPNYSVNINRLPSLQPAVWTHFIPSLLLSADVQTFCSEKESLFVTLESFKEREKPRPLPVSPSATIQPTKQQIPISMQSLLSITPSASHASVMQSADRWFCCCSWLSGQRYENCVLLGSGDVECHLSQ